MKHITLDLFNCREDLSIKDDAKFFLVDCARKLKQTIIGEPVVYEFPGDPVGLTGFQILGESHISIHTYPENGTCYIDIFSCAGFSTQEAIDYCKNFWACGDVCVNVLERQK